MGFINVLSKPYLPELSPLPGPFLSPPFYAPFYAGNWLWCLDYFHCRGVSLKWCTPVHCPYRNTLTVGYRIHRKNKAYFIILSELKIFCLDMWAAPSRVVCPSLFWSCILLCWGRRSREDWVETQLLYSRPALTVINQWHWNGYFVVNVGFLSFLIPLHPLNYLYLADLTFKGKSILQYLCIRF